MYAVEFQTTVKNGVIEIPSQYQKNFQRKVRVILMAEENAHPSQSFIDHLLTHPLRVKKFQPLTREEIYAR